MGSRAVFFDRDGTLNVDKDYLHRREDFIWCPGAMEAVRYVNDMGYLAIVVTNQSGVARGFYPEEDVVTLHRWMNEQLAKIGAHLDDLYYCPHHPEGKIAAYRKVCHCRKPDTLLVDKACEKHSIERECSYLVGDAPRDMECAQRAGLTGIRYKGGDLAELLKQHLPL